MPGRILIIDDDAGFAGGLARSLRLQSHEVTIYTSAADARRGADASADVVVVDYQLPDADKTGNARNNDQPASMFPKNVSRSTPLFSCLDHCRHQPGDKHAQHQ